MAKYIDRDKLLNLLREDRYRYPSSCSSGLCLAMKEINEMPTADVVEVKHGYWRKIYDKAPRYVCSACNHLFNNKEYKFCPHCGACMDGTPQKEGVSGAWETNL